MVPLVCVNYIKMVFFAFVCPLFNFVKIVCHSPSVVPKGDQTNKKNKNPSPF